MIDAEHAHPITRQAELPELSRASVYYLPRATPEADLGEVADANNTKCESSPSLRAD